MAGAETSTRIQDAPGAASPGEFGERVVDQVLCVVPVDRTADVGHRPFLPGFINGGPDWLPAGERDDVATGAGAHVTKLLVFQGELVHGADEGGDVSA
jgi:hypothetical protein